MISWETIKTHSGQSTVLLRKDEGEFLLHSKYNPMREAERWLEQWNAEEENPDKICVVGIGAGYHLQELCKRFPNVIKTVFDFNSKYVCWLKESELFRNLELKNIEIFIADDMRKVKENLLPLLDDPNTLVMIHAPSLELIPKDLMDLRIQLDNYVTFLRTVRKNRSILEENFCNNLKLQDKGVLTWKNTLSNKPVLLISAGPSLTKQLPLLKKIQTDVYMVCVGTALMPLMNYGIKPNAVMIAEPQGIILEQFMGVKSTPDIPMFYLATANHKAVNYYKGSRYIIWQRDYSQSKEEAELRGEPTILSGGSVATCLLDLLVWMGSNRIGLVGQDLAFTDGFSHAQGTHNLQRIDTDNHLQVVDFYQKETVSTPKHLYSYLKWFERYAQSLKDSVDLWNCTEGGAFIKGWKHGSLENFIEL